MQALLAAETADAIVGFLHRVHRQDRMLPKITPALRYDDNPDFNDYINEMHEQVRIFDEEFLPSKVLFELATEPYKIYLGAHKAEQDDNEEATVDTKPDEDMP